MASQRRQGAESAPLRAVRLLVVSERPLMRQCLASALGAVERYSVILVVAGLGAALERLGTARVDAAVIDLGRSGEPTMELLAELTGRHPGLKVVVLDGEGGEGQLGRCLEAGVDGYLLQDASLRRLIDTLDAVVGGETVLSAAVARTLFTRLAELDRRRRRHRQMEALVLTPRQMQVLRLMADGLPNQEIAARLNLSPYTVKNHVHNILERLGVQDRTEAVAHAFKKRWF